MRELAAPVRSFTVRSSRPLAIPGARRVSNAVEALPIVGAVQIRVSASAHASPDTAVASPVVPQRPLMAATHFGVHGRRGVGCHRLDRGPTASSSNRDRWRVRDCSESGTRCRPGPSRTRSPRPMLAALPSVASRSAASQPMPAVGGFPPGGGAEHATGSDAHQIVRSPAGGEAQTTRVNQGRNESTPLQR